MVPSTMKAGAASCQTVAKEASSAAQRVAGLHLPEGVPPEAIGDLHAASAQLEHSSTAALHEFAFLVLRLTRGLHADGPLYRALVALGGLVSPWGPPVVVKKPKHHWWDPATHLLNAAKNIAVDKVKDDLSMLDGAKDELLSVAGGAVDLTLAGVGRTIDGPFGIPLHLLGIRTPSDYIPFVGDRTRQLDRAAVFAGRHPIKFLEAVGKDTIAYDDLEQGHYAHAKGRIAISALAFLVAPTKAAEASKAAEVATVAADDAVRAGEKVSSRLGEAGSAEKAAADRLRATAISGEAIGKDLAAWRVAQRQHAQAVIDAENAQSRVDAALAKAHEAQVHAHELRGELPKEELKAARDHVGIATGKVLMDPETGAEPEKAEK